MYDYTNVYIIKYLFVYSQYEVLLKNLALFCSYVIPHASFNFWAAS